MGVEEGLEMRPEETRQREFHETAVTWIYPFERMSPHGLAFAVFAVDQCHIVANDMAHDVVTGAGTLENAHVAGQTFMEEPIGTDGAGKEDVVVEIYEVLCQVFYFVKVNLYRVAAEYWQRLDGDIIFVTDKMEFGVTEV